MLKCGFAEPGYKTTTWFRSKILHNTGDRIEEAVLHKLNGEIEK